MHTPQYLHPGEAEPRFKLTRFAFGLWMVVAYVVEFNFFRIYLSKFLGVAETIFGIDQLWHALGNTPSIGTTNLVLLLAALLLFNGVRIALAFIRLRQVGLNRSWSLLWILPMIDLLATLILAILPDKDRDLPLSHAKNHNQYGELIARIIPKSKLGSAAMAVGLITPAVLVLMLIGIYIIGDYSWIIFAGMPFYLGLGSVMLYSFHQPRRLMESLGVAFVSILVLSLLLLGLAIEGFVCVLMAAPLGIVMGLLGGALAYSITSFRTARYAPSLLVGLYFFLPGGMAVESSMDLPTPEFTVTSSMKIDAPPSVVWHQVITFSELPEPEELLFRSGISYPIRATIEGSGVGAIRYCTFNTGSFVEPITTWDEPRLLAFDVVDQPDAMTELSPYGPIDAPHVEGYFRSKKGQFLLTELPDGSTLLKGTTWYEHEIWPTSYWRVYSDHILHQIHYRVLGHIKQGSEEYMATADINN